MLQHQLAPFSVVTRRAKAKKQAGRHVKKYKLKTRKAAQKRFHVVGKKNERSFKYHAVGHRHLNRNKSRANLKRAKRRHVLGHLADVRKMRRLLPYFKKRRSLRS